MRRIHKKAFSKNNFRKLQQHLILKELNISQKLTFLKNFFTYHRKDFKDKQTYQGEMARRIETKCGEFIKNGTLSGQISLGA